VSASLRPEALAEIVRAAGAIVRRDFGAPVDVAIKADGSPVTPTDQAVDDFLKAELPSLVPEAAWLSEESADDRARLQREAVWIVDPIDGTKQFVRRLPEIAISVALVRGGRPVAAAVSNPIAGHEGIWVEGTAPAFRGLEARPAPDSLETAEAIVSRSESEDGGLVGFEDVAGSVRQVGSVAYKLLRVASGADALTYSVRPKSEWDICAGVGLLRAAGRVFLRLDDVPVVFNRPDPRIPSGAVAGPRAIAEAARREIVRRLGGAVRAS
jgi:myo-inositol-1(or 4)-monophosphatase